MAAVGDGWPRGGSTCYSWEQRFQQQQMQAGLDQQWNQHRCCFPERSEGCFVKYMEAFWLGWSLLFQQFLHQQQ